jgi:predicted RNase H-like nuclease (RuvC/YqgF family)
MTKGDHDGIMEILGRVDERVKALVESNDYLKERFDKFLDLHSELTERVTHLEASFDEDALEKMETKYYTLDQRITPLEMKVMESDALKARMASLEERAFKLERITEVQNSAWVRWTGAITKGIEVLFKIGWVIGMAWILYRLGLGGVNFPP